LMGGDRGEGEVLGVPTHHPHLTSPIKGEETIAAGIYNLLDEGP